LVLEHLNQQVETYHQLLALIHLMQLFKLPLEAKEELRELLTRIQVAPVGVEVVLIWP
jgi:hypothetical protein